MWSFGSENSGCTSLHVRTWTCTHCGSVHDRDPNAAKNG
ncbi:zinc ribbon domain-containing protein [Streptomyces mirabilis]